MYIPKYFRVANADEVWDFVQKNSFGTIVTTNHGKPIATHLPLQLRKEEEDYYITGHIAYGNPQWKAFETSEDVLIIFQGPHAYISSSWYEKENVPTWNYQAVHVYGTVSNLDQLEDSLASADFTMTPEMYAEISRLSRTPAPATDRTEVLTGKWS